MVLETTATTLTLVALKKITTHLTTKLLEKKWSQETESAKELIFQLSKSDATHTYVEKYVSRFLKMRTLHSAESDVYLDEIYSPLTLTVQSNDDKLCVNDEFTLSFREVINIIGLAGQGKSTILRKLFLEEMKKGERFPFLIELRRVENTTIFEYLKGILTDIGLDVHDDAVELLLQSKKMVLMLDGFDEVSSINRQTILNEIIQLNTRYCCDIIVTTRPDTEICHEVNITNLRVNNLNKNDIISILNKLDKFNELSELPILISQNIALQETLITPILVNLLFVCYPYLDVLPENVTDFYDKLFMTLYSRHDKIKNFNREKYSELTSVEGNKIFNAFCFNTISKGVLDFTETTLYDNLKVAFKLNNIDSNNNIDKIQKDLIDITCLLQRDGFDRYVFLHKSIQEFHAAKFIASLPHKHKERFYKKLSSIVDIEDKYDNVLTFLQHVDKEEYESLFILNYFEQCKLHHLHTENADMILNNHINNIFKNKKLILKVNNETQSYTCESVSGMTHNNLFSTMSLFKYGTRNHTFPFYHVLLEILFNAKFSRTKEIDIPTFKKVSIDELISLSIESKITSQPEDNNYDDDYDVNIDIYLKTIGAEDYIVDLMKESITTLCNEIYSPIKSRI